jgi:endonuclease III
MGGNAPDLQSVCEHLIVSPEALSSMTQALIQHRGLLFLEDLVAAYGYELPPSVVDQARQRSRAFDELVGGERWQSDAAAVVSLHEHRPKPDGSQFKRVAEQLLRIRSERGDTLFWPWLDSFKGRPADKKAANKFLLGAILDWQIPANRAWDNAERFAEGIFGDPDDLWQAIVAVPQSEWDSMWKAYALHRFRVGHTRVWKIAQRIVVHYRGDARLIWEGQNIAAVLDRLSNLEVGEQISRMVAGALLDTGQIEGIGDVKADRHVCRVLGRVLRGFSVSPAEATALARQIFPENPWVLDRPLFLIGKEICVATHPLCHHCGLRPDCVYHRQHQAR